MYVWDELGQRTVACLIIRLCKLSPQKAGSINYPKSVANSSFFNNFFFYVHVIVIVVVKCGLTLPLLAS